MKEAENWDIKRKKVHYKYYDVDVNGAYKQLDNLNAKEVVRQERLKKNKEAREKEYEVKHVKELAQSLRRFSRIDSKRLLNFSKKLLIENVDFTLLNKVEELMLGMFH